MASEKTTRTADRADSDICPHCGQPVNRVGLDQFLGRLGITESTIDRLTEQFENVDIDEYLNTARDYLSGIGAPDSHRSSPRRIVLFPDEPGTLGREAIEDAIAHAVSKT